MPNDNSSYNQPAGYRPLGNTLGGNTQSPFSTNTNGLPGLKPLGGNLGQQKSSFSLGGKTYSFADQPGAQFMYNYGTGPLSGNVPDPNGVFSGPIMGTGTGISGTDWYKKMGVSDQTAQKFGLGASAPDTSSIPPGQAVWDDRTGSYIMSGGQKAVGPGQNMAVEQNYVNRGADPFSGQWNPFQTQNVIDQSGAQIPQWQKDLNAQTQSQFNQNNAAAQSGQVQTSGVTSPIGLAGTTLNPDGTQKNAPGTFQNLGQPVSDAERQLAQYNASNPNSTYTSQLKNLLAAKQVDVQNRAADVAFNTGMGQYNLWQSRAAKGQDPYSGYDPNTSSRIQAQLDSIQDPATRAQFLRGQDPANLTAEQAREQFSINNGVSPEGWMANSKNEQYGAPPSIYSQIPQGFKGSLYTTYQDQVVYDPTTKSYRMTPNVPISVRAQMPSRTSLETGLGTFGGALGGFFAAGGPVNPLAATVGAGMGAYQGYNGGNPLQGMNPLVPAVSMGLGNYQNAGGAQSGYSTIGNFTSNPTEFFKNGGLQLGRM